MEALDGDTCMASTANNDFMRDNAQMVKLFFQFLDAEFKQTIMCEQHSAYINGKQLEMRNSSRLEKEDMCQYDSRTREVEWRASRIPYLYTQAHCP